MTRKEAIKFIHDDLVGKPIANTGWAEQLLETIEKMGMLPPPTLKSTVQNQVKNVDPFAKTVTIGPVHSVGIVNEWDEECEKI